MMATTSGIEVRQPYYQSGDILPSRVTSQGAVVVNEVSVRRDYGDCILAVMDLASEYAELAYTLSYVEDDVELYLRATGNTRHVHERAPRAALTLVTITDLLGWSVWASSGPHRGTLALTLCCPRNET